jgi:hypothetical protein
MMTRRIPAAVGQDNFGTHIRNTIPACLLTLKQPSNEKEQYEEIQRNDDLPTTC